MNLKIINRKPQPEDLNNPIFDSLKVDYGERDFSKWYKTKAVERDAFFIMDEDTNEIMGLSIFKEETVQDLEHFPWEVPNGKYFKICTFKVSDEIGSQRLGQNLIKKTLILALEKGQEYIYFTVKNETSLELGKFVERYGFKKIGNSKKGDETIYIKSFKKDYDNSTKNFPKIKLQDAKILTIQERYHDRFIFNSKEVLGLNDSSKLISMNSISKIYITKYSGGFSKGDLIFIYRMHGGNKSKGSLSKLTGFGIVENSKRNWGIETNDEQKWEKAKTTSAFKNLDDFKETMKLNEYYDLIEFNHNYSFGKENEKWDLNKMRSHLDLGEGTLHGKSITKDNVKKILKECGVNDSFIIN